MRWASSESTGGIAPSAWKTFLFSSFSFPDSLELSEMSYFLKHVNGSGFLKPL